MKIPNDWLNEKEPMLFKQFTIRLFELETITDLNTLSYYHQRYQSYLILHAKAHSASDEKVQSLLKKD